MSHKGPRKAPQRRAPKGSPYAGPATVLRCEDTFQVGSDGRIACAPAAGAALDQEPSEERRVPLHPPTRRGRNRDEGYSEGTDRDFPPTIASRLDLQEQTDEHAGQLMVASNVVWQRLGMPGHTIGS